MRALLIVSVAILASVANAHPGRTDSRGGHHDRKHGGYHYHSGPRATPATTPSRPAVTPPPAPVRRSTPSPPVASFFAGQATPAPPRKPAEPAPPTPDWRTWVSANGKYQLRAAALEADSTAVLLQKQGGGTVRVAVNLLAPASQAALRWSPRQEQFPKCLFGNVLRVVDGDTLVIQRADGEQVTVRLEGIDAPESKQIGGATATTWLQDRLTGRWVRIAWKETDRYGRTLGHVFAGPRWVNRDLVVAGCAWHYLKYSQDAELAAAEQQAREHHVGLWSDEAPQPPWEYRAAKKAAAASDEQAAFAQ